MRASVGGCSRGAQLRPRAAHQEDTTLSGAADLAARPPGRESGRHCRGTRSRGALPHLVTPNRRKEVEERARSRGGALPRGAAGVARARSSRQRSSEPTPPRACRATKDQLPTDSPPPRCHSWEGYRVSTSVRSPSCAASLAAWCPWEQHIAGCAGRLPPATAAALCGPPRLRALPPPRMSSFPAVCVTNAAAAVGFAQCTRGGRPGARLLVCAAGEGGGLARQVGVLGAHAPPGAPHAEERPDGQGGKQGNG